MTEYVHIRLSSTGRSDGECLHLGDGKETDKLQCLCDHIASGIEFCHDTFVDGSSIDIGIDRFDATVLLDEIGCCLRADTCDARDIV